MIIVMKPNADESSINQIVDLIKQKGLSEHISRGQEHTIIGAVGDERVFDVAEFERFEQVEKAIRIVQDWRMISREAWAEDTIFTIRNVAIGGQNPIFGHKIQQNHLNHLNLNSQYNPNYSNHSNHIIHFLDPFFLPNNPYLNHFNHHLNHYLSEYIDYINQIHNKKQIIMIRIRDSQQIDWALSAQADILYIGGELIENIRLLHQVGYLNTPVVLCKAKYHGVRDWLMAAEQIVLKGNQQVILGEAGVINYHYQDNLRLDIEGIAQAKKLSHLPILADLTEIIQSNHKFMSSEQLSQLAQIAGANMIIS